MIQKVVHETLDFKPENLAGNRTGTGNIEKELVGVILRVVCDYTYYYYYFDIYISNVIGFEFLN